MVRQLVLHMSTYIYLWQIHTLKANIQRFQRCIQTTHPEQWGRVAKKQKSVAVLWKRNSEFFFSHLEKFKEGYCREYGGLLHANPFDGEKAGGGGGDDWEEAGGSGAEGGEAHLRTAAGSHWAGQQKKRDGAAFEHRGPPPPFAGQESIVTLVGGMSLLVKIHSSFLMHFVWFGFFRGFLHLVLFRLQDPALT